MFSLEIHTRENGFFVKFDNKEECNKVLQKKPWLSDGRLIILKQWSLDINVERESSYLLFLLGWDSISTSQILVSIYHVQTSKSS